jgi:hypothetical protein
MKNPKIKLLDKLNKLKLIMVLVMVFCSSPHFGLQVAEDEIRIDRTIEFENYTGPHTRVDTVDSIRSIGRQLARGARDSKDGQFGYHMRYTIIRATSTEEAGKYSADIFSIDRQARVSHVRNIRRILAAYLQTMYGYSSENAWTLATFLTYYNAVYRGNIDYFSPRYKSVVMKHINAENAGLATSYREWAGKTRMLIPLRDDRKEGDLDLIDPDLISDRQVVEEMRKDPDAIEDRKDMTDIKERVIERDKDEIEREKEEIRREETRLAERERELEDAKRDPDKSADEIAKEEEKLRAEREELDKRIEKTEDKEEVVREREDTLREERREIRSDEVARDIDRDPDKARETLREQQRELEAREDRLRQEQLHQNIYQDKFYYLKINEYKPGGHYFNEMYMVDPAEKQIVLKSPVENIAGSRYDIFSEGVVIITRNPRGRDVHNLMMLDRNTLDRKAASADNIFWRSFVVVRDEHIYAIINDGGKFYLGKFNKNLQAVAKSSDRINENTFITFYQNFVFINRHDREILVLDKDSLKTLDVVKPADVQKMTRN